MLFAMINVKHAVFLGLFVGVWKGLEGLFYLISLGTNFVGNNSDGNDEVTALSDTWFDGRMCKVEESDVERLCMLNPRDVCDGVASCQHGNFSVGGKDYAGVGLYVRCYFAGVDECLCWDGYKLFIQPVCFRCLSNHAYVLPITKLCDGVFHCPDLSDECLCNTDIRPKVCDKFVSGEGIDSKTRYPYFECQDPKTSLQIFINTTLVCDGRIDCKNGEDERFCENVDATLIAARRTPVKDYICSNEKNVSACDGESGCECNDSLPTFCEASRGDTAMCSEILDYAPQKAATSKEFCDGVQDYDNLSDEFGCKTRFYCDSDHPLPNFPMENVCDRIDDCPNGEDERNCSNFKCNDGGSMQYVPLYEVCNGKHDCHGGLDECQPGCIDSSFSDENSLITSKLTLAFIWIFSITAIVGCSAVIVLTAHDLFMQRGKRNFASISNHTKLSKLLVLNLSLSDFLVGLYTFIICIKSVEFNRDYCLVDREWRSSSMCSALGALVVIGSEQSVFIMVLLTIQRLRAIVRPFWHPRILHTVAAIVITWCVSIALGVAPLLSSTEDYFVRSIAFEGCELFNVINHNEKEMTVVWLNLMRESSNLEWSSSWETIKGLLVEMNPNLTVAHQYGYYSSHTVCLPTFFPDRSTDNAWRYSLLLLLINFLAFFVMLVSYIVIYRKSTGNEALGSSFKKDRGRQNIRMQRKLTRILLSDFMCWMPVCIMGFLKLGGVDIPADAYLPTGLLIIPINSALNPLLYSDLPDKIWRMITGSRRSHFRTLPQRSESSTHSTEQRLTNL